MLRCASALLLLCGMLRPVASQQRCHLGDVRRPDGSYLLGRCDELLLHGETIGDDGAAALAKALGSDTRLRLLDLWSNGLGPKGAEALAGALKVNTKLERLYLNENPIGSQGAGYIVEALTSNRALAHLWLSRCQLGDAGAEAVAAALSNTRMRRLEALDLWGNGFGPTGGIAIATALRTNRMLRTLELRDNEKMGDEVARAFAETMSKNAALGTLDLVSTGISPAGTAALLAGLKVSTAGFYLIVFAEGFPHLQATSWEQKGRPNAP